MSEFPNALFHSASPSTRGQLKESLRVTDRREWVSKVNGIILVINHKRPIRINNKASASNFVAGVHPRSRIQVECAALLDDRYGG